MTEDIDSVPWEIQGDEITEDTRRTLATILLESYEQEFAICL
jgi:hypothetical protein